MPVPTFFIVGAPGCGTSSLYAYLSAHPDIFVCRPKEPHHLGSDLDLRPRPFAERMRCILHDDLKAEPERVYRETVGFLGLEPGGRPEFKVHNERSLWRSPRAGPLLMRGLRRGSLVARKLPTRALPGRRRWRWSACSPQCRCASISPGLGPVAGAAGGAEGRVQGRRRPPGRDPWPRPVVVARARLGPSRSCSNGQSRDPHALNLGTALPCLVETLRCRK